MRCTLLQIFMIVPEISEIPMLVEHLKRCSNFEDRESEIQLTFSTILKTIVENEGKNNDFTEEYIDLMTRIGLKSESTTKILEIILHMIKRKSSFGSKLSSIRATMPQINWKLVDEGSGVGRETEMPSNGEISIRLNKLQSTWSIKENLSDMPTLESFVTSTSDGADLETGDGAFTSIFSMRFPSVSTKSKQKFNFEEAI